MIKFRNHRSKRNCSSILQKRKLAVLFLLLTAITIEAQENVLKVGTNAYTDTDMRIKFSQGFFSYEKLVLDLAREEAVMNLKKNSPKVYKEFISIKEMTAGKKNADSAESKMYLSTRKLMLDTWLDQKAIRIPVRYLDAEKIYDISSEFNREISIPYTFAELQTTEQNDLVKKNGKTYLSAAEYNDYVKENYYRRIIRYANRDMPVSKVKNLAVRMITAEKLSAESINLKDVTMDEVDIESYVSRYINEYMFLDDRSISDSEYETPTQMTEGIYVKYSNNHKDELNRLRDILQGKTDGAKEPFIIQFFIRTIKLDFVKTPLTRRPTDAMINEWVLATHYNGTAIEAEWFMKDEEYSAIIKQYDTKQELKVYPFN
jgi:hypothetical protein